MSCDFDLYEAVEELERKEYEGGEREGTKEGEKEQYGQGFSLGWQQACHILQEIGALQGLLASILLNRESEMSPRLHGQISRLVSTIREWPTAISAPQEEMGAELASIQAKARHLLGRIGVSSEVVDRSVDGDF